LIPFAPTARRIAGDSVHDLLGERLGVAGVAAQFERVVDNADPGWVADHRIASEVVMPLTAYLEAALAAARQVDATATALESVEVGEPLPLRESERRIMRVSVRKAEAGTSLSVQVFSRAAGSETGPWSLHASAVAKPGIVFSPAGPPLSEVARTLSREIPVVPFYDKLRNLGVDFGPGFRAMHRVWCGEGEALGEIEAGADVLGDAGNYLMHPALLDG